LKIASREKSSIAFLETKFCIVHIDQSLGHCCVKICSVLSSHFYLIFWHCHVHNSDKKKRLPVSNRCLFVCPSVIW
jgi:hypothetical protein